MSDKSLQSILDKYPVFEEASHGKLLCTLTKHEMPISDISKYVKTKKFCYNYDAFVIERDYGQYFQLLEPGILACLLTKRSVSKNGKALRNHINGQRFQKALKQAKEDELKAAQEAELKATEENELKAAQEAELKATEENELKAAQEAELKATEEDELNLNNEKKLNVKNDIKSEPMECDNNNETLNDPEKELKSSVKKSKKIMKRRSSNIYESGKKIKI